MANAKSPLELSNEFVNPFNTRRISHISGRTPKSMLGDNRRLINLSANDYYKLVANQWNTTPEEVMKSRQTHTNEMSIEDMRKHLQSGKKFDTPYIKLLDDGSGIALDFQEGLHRMLAAGQEYGMDTKFPVWLGYETDPWNEIDTMSMDDFLKHYETTRNKRNEEWVNEQKRKKEEDEKRKRRIIAKDYGVSPEELTQEMIDEYDAEWDEIWDNIIKEKW